MPMIHKTEFGMVIAIWGQAWIRDANGHFRALKLGDAVHKGDVVLTTQDSIVQLAQADAAPEEQPATTKATEITDADSVIESLNQGDARTAPAAGLTGGDSGDLTPGYRVERIVELTTPAGQLRSSGLDTANRRWLGTPSERSPPPRCPRCGSTPPKKAPTSASVWSRPRVRRRCASTSCRRSARCCKPMAPRCWRAAC